MSLEDVEKITLRTIKGNFYYTGCLLAQGMLFAQREMITVFPDMIHECLKDYIDDM